MWCAPSRAGRKSFMDDLSTAILGAALAPPPEAALAVMKLSLVDCLAVGLAGRAEPAAEIVRDTVLAEGGRGEAALLGGGRAPARGAALVNGTAAHALDYDDTHFAHIGHPSVAVVPAALAVGEAQGAGREAVIAAALAGCEASVRYGLAFGRSHYQAGFHQTATAGAFGATVAAVRLLSDAPEVMAQALGLVSTRAAGLKSQFGTMGKPYNAGAAAANGVEAARLAARGFVSNPDAVTGPQGFLDTHHARGACDQAPGFLMEGVSHKFHACCHGLHAALEALERLKPADPARIERVAITVHRRWLSVCNKPRWRTGLEAKFSYRAVTALSLLGHPTARLETFSDALCRRDDVTALGARVEVAASDGMPETAARVTLQDATGTRHSEHDLADPMTPEARAARVRAKAAALLGEGRAGALWQAVHGPGAGLEAITACLA